MVEVAVVAPEFDAVYRAHYAPLVRLAYLTTGSLAAAEDLAQDAFVEWWLRTLREYLDDPAAGGEPPVLPARLHGGSWRTASVAEAPPGAAIAVFTHATTRTISQPVVVAADGRTYRDLDGADYALLSGAGAVALLLSPDGTRVAGVAGRVLDLGTGRLQRYPLLPGDTEQSWAASVPLSWSPDGRWLAFAVAASDVSRPPGSAGQGGGLALLDLDTGRVSVVDTNAGGYQQVAFAPDGTEFAVSVSDEAGPQPQTVVTVFDVTGRGGDGRGGSRRGGVAVAAGRPSSEGPERVNGRDGFSGSVGSVARSGQWLGRVSGVPQITRWRSGRRWLPGAGRGPGVAAGSAASRRSYAAAHARSP
jgi:hypothetical protein